MLELRLEAIPPETCRRAFRMMMWAFLFFMPLPIPFLGLLPDLVGWALLLAGLQMVCHLGPPVGFLRLLTIVGSALWISRAVAWHVGLPHPAETHLLLYVATWAVLTVFVWKLCDLVQQVASAGRSESIVQSARWHRWLCLLPSAAFAASTRAAHMPQWAQHVLFCLLLLVSLCVVSALMGLMARIAGMCALAEHLGASGPARAQGP